MGLLDESVEVVMVPADQDAWSMIALRVEATAHEGGWHSNDDAPTGLYWLHEHDSGGLGPAVAVAEPQFPEGRFPALHPVPLLRMLEQRMKPLRTLVGFVLVTEGWMVVGKPDDAAARKYTEALGAERRLHQHPDRIEVRQAHLITLHPRQERVVLRRRDHEPEVRMFGAEYGGAVPAAMRSLADALRRRRYGRRG